MEDASHRPAVSIAIAAYNAEPWIKETLESAVAQTLDDLEIVIVDDASTDATAAEAARVVDPRIRYVKNERNLGQSATWNRAIALCRAPVVKFLCADDLLHADCVERMLVPFDESEAVGMAFSRREIELDADEPSAVAWRDEYETIFRRFGTLEAVNSGRKMFETCLSSGFEDNWIGEPSNVMVRRSLFERLPGFHPHIRQPVDMEVWVRLMFHADVAFVDAPLATYRVLTNSVTQQTARQGSRWLDRVWLVEALLDDPQIRSRYPELRRIARTERRRAFRELTRGLARPARLGKRMHEAREYLSYRAAGRTAGEPLLAS